MKLLIGLVLALLGLTGDVEAGKSKRMYLLSSKPMKYDKIKKYCAKYNGWPAVMDKQNMREAYRHLQDEGVTEAHVGKRLRKHYRRPKLVIKDDEPLVRDSKSKTKELRALCQREKRSKKSKKSKSHGSKSSKSHKYNF